MVRRGQKGFSLIEAAVVLGIVGLVIGGIWVAATAVRAKYIEDEVSKDVGQQLKAAFDYILSKRPLADMALNTLDAVQSKRALGMLPSDCRIATPGGGFYGCNSARYPWSNKIDVDSNGVIYISISANQWPAAEGSSRFSPAQCMAIGRGMAQASRTMAPNRGNLGMWWDGGSGGLLFEPAMAYGTLSTYCANGVWTILVIVG